MKKLILMAVMACSLTVAARPNERFSAFTEKGVLYVSILLDDCNTFEAYLDVDPLCQADRLTKNYAQTCDLSVSVGGTELACSGSAVREFTFDLDKSNVAPEANTLNINYMDETIRVQVER